MVGALIASAVATAISANIAAYNTYAQGKEAKRQANHAAAEAEKQAALEQERANIAQIQGEQDATRRMRDYAQEVGSVYANAAANGILIDSGSSGDTLGRTLDTSSRFAAHDVSTIRDNTTLTMWTHTENKKQLLASAKNLRKQGKKAYQAGILGALASHFTGAAEFSSGMSKVAMVNHELGKDSALKSNIKTNSDWLNNSGGWQGGSSFFKTPNKAIA